MDRLLLALVASLALAAPAQAADRPFPVADFERLIVEGSYRVQLVVGRATTAVASGTREGLDRVSVESSGRTLRIRPRRDAWGANAAADPGPVTIRLTTRSLRSARLLGPAVLEVDGAGAGVAPGGRDVEFLVQGSGTIRATRVTADSATVTANTVGTVALKVNGRAEITAYGLGTVTIAGTPACMLSGPGVANVRCGGSDQGQVR